MRVTLKYIDGAIMTCDTLPKQGARIDTATLGIDGNELVVAFDKSQLNGEWSGYYTITKTSRAAENLFDWCKIKNEEEGLVALEVDGELVWAYEPPSSDDVNLTVESDGFEDFGEDDYIGF